VPVTIVAGSAMIPETKGRRNILVRRNVRRLAGCHSRRTTFPTRQPETTAADAIDQSSSRREI
jgi:hypothetical protein